MVSINIKADALATRPRAAVVRWRDGFNLERALCESAPYRSEWASIVTGDCDHRHRPKYECHRSLALVAMRGIADRHHGQSPKALCRGRSPSAVIAWCLHTEEVLTLERRAELDGLIDPRERSG